MGPLLPGEKKEVLRASKQGRDSGKDVAWTGSFSYA